jgi:hypothetical protein
MHADRAAFVKAVFRDDDLGNAGRAGAGVFQYLKALREMLLSFFAAPRRLLALELIAVAAQKNDAAGVLLDVAGLAQIR